MGVTASPRQAAKSSFGSPAVPTSVADFLVISPLLCYQLVYESLSVRTHICTSCGYVADRDVNAAKNILFKAGAQPSGTVSNGSPVELRSPRL